MKKIIFVLIIVLIAFICFGKSKIEYYDNNTNIQAVYVIENPYPSKITEFFVWLNSHTTYNIEFRIDSAVNYWYVFSITSYLNDTKENDIDKEADKTLGGLADSNVKPIKKDFSDTLFLTAIGVQ